ncbi:transglutaminase-like domain-containing protein [Leptospira idonii]|uniref:Transglutaminase n=1 Tax=Leptospira idonii TaxID=1193500 RepID=A0A4R9LXD0_9LEPT|nr:transglutaminase-like domain-containing protein [Leptospira idonii]TGN18963.1 transglutaminase [Leptospira idonii]
MAQGHHPNFSADDITRLLYDWEIAPSEKKRFLLKMIASRIPWQMSVEDAAEEVKDPFLRVQARNIGPELFRHRIRHSFYKLTLRGNTGHYKDLEESVVQLSSLGFPNQSYMEMKKELDRIALRISELFDEHSSHLTEEMKVQILCQVLYQEEGFVGNIQNYNDPSNSYLQHVLKSRLGIPISLSVVYLLVAQRLGLPLYGTNLPLHFLLQYESGSYFTYIDPFHGGVLLDRFTCEKFLEANGYPLSPKYFTKASTLSMIKRMCRNLIHIYREKQSKEMETLIKDQLSILESRSTPAE